MGHKLTRVTFSARDFSMAERETLQVVIQRFKLKKTIILLEILEEDGKKGIKVDERRPGKRGIPLQGRAVTLLGTGI